MYTNIYKYVAVDIDVTTHGLCCRLFIWSGYSTYLYYLYHLFIHIFCSVLMRVMEHMSSG